jgi:glycosyltransferase involved in cell wall biosynthesis
VGSRMGGIVNLVQHEHGGLLYDAFSAEELARALTDIIESPGRLARFREALPEVKSIEQDATEWEKIYHSLRFTGEGPP